MKYKQSRLMTSTAMDVLIKEFMKLNYSHEASKISDFRRKYISCGCRSLMGGRRIRYFCRSAVCPTCSRFSSKRSAKDFLSGYAGPQSKYFKMISLVISLSSNLTSLLSKIRNIKKRFQNEVRRRRNRTNGQIWNTFGFAGSFEIDMFYAHDFQKLGSRKQVQYTGMGFPQFNHNQGPMWVLTFHGAVFSKYFSATDLRSIFQSQSHVVHFKSCDTRQTAEQAITNIIGYSAKVNYKTGLAKGKNTIWALHEVGTYIRELTACSKGRQLLKFCIKPNKIGLRIMQQKYISNSH